MNNFQLLKVETKQSAVLFDIDGGTQDRSTISTELILDQVDTNRVAFSIQCSRSMLGCGGSYNAMSQSLRDFVAPIMVGDLTQSQKRGELPLHAGKSMVNCAKLFSWERLLEASAKTHGPNQLRVNLRRQPIAPWMLQTNDAPDPEKLDRLLKHGASLIIQSAHRWDDQLGKIVEEFRQESRDKTWIGAIGSTGEDGALVRHSDRYDLFIVQIEGAKDWTIYERGEDSDSIALKVALTPGDYLYVPAGYPHECQVLDTRSLHLGLGIAVEH